MGRLRRCWVTYLRRRRSSDILGDMNIQNSQKGGFVWFVVSLVLAIVLAVVLLGDKDAGNEVKEDLASDTSGLESGASEVATTTSAAAPTPVPAKTTTVKPAAKPATSVAPKMTASGAYIVYYTSKGFSPASLGLVRGQSVHFVNNSSSALRIAPVDTRNKPYAEFSQSKSVGYGGTFDYTFTSSGAYGYYNENNKSHQAIISVN